MPKQSPTTQVIVPRSLIVYKRPRNNVWQCRYKVANIWQRATTNETNLTAAIAKARELQIDAEVLKRNNVPIETRYVRNVAKLAIEKMEDELERGVGKVIYKDYIQVIKKYLIEILGNRKINNIDYAALNHLDAERIRIMRKQPSPSTLLTHNAAFNKVFEIAIDRGWISATAIPKLTTKAHKTTRRPAFDLVELKALLGNFDSWIARADNEEDKEWRVLLRDYVEILLDTGARPGVELLNLKWNQIRLDTRAKLGKVVADEYGEAQQDVIVDRAVLMTVTGKGRTREIVGNPRTVMALKRILERNYGERVLSDWLKKRSNDYVIRNKNKESYAWFNAMFDRYLEEHNLLIDPVTNLRRVLYSLRHTYATLALEHDKVPIHTLTKQMGNSVAMVEKHYSHLEVIKAIEQLRNTESRQLIDAGDVIDDMYTSKQVKKDKTDVKAS